MIIKIVRTIIKNKKIQATLKYSIRYYRALGRQKIILLNTPTHGNIGDQAIAVAERKFLKDKMPHAYVCEVDEDELEFHFNIWKDLIQTDDLLLVHGGGFLGDLWIEEELRFRRILEEYPNNQLIVLPQTIFYRDESSIEQTRESYQKRNKKPFVFLRDHNSHVFFEKHFSDVAEFELVPDIVMSMEYIFPFERKGVLLCLRNDGEKGAQTRAFMQMKEWSDCHLDEVTFTDTCVDHPITRKNRQFEVQTKLAQFASHKYVITDRLHGMIFAAITGTPCIAFDNISKKVSSGYNWLKEQPYIYMVEDDEEWETCLDKISQIEAIVYRYNRNSLSDKYDAMAELIRKKWQG